MKLTRDFFESHGWERDDFEFEGKMIWQARLRRSKDKGDPYYADATITNMMYPQRFAISGDITGDMKVSHLMLITVEQYEMLMKMVGVRE